MRSCHEALRIALEHDLAGEALRAYNNLIVLLSEAALDEPSRRGVERTALSLARRRGDRFWEARALDGSASGAAATTGDWDEALALAETLPRPSVDTAVMASFCGVAALELESGHQERATGWLEGIPEPGDEATADRQVMQVALWARQARALADGRVLDALEAAESAVLTAVKMAATLGLGEQLRAAATLSRAIGEPARAEQVAAPLAALPPSAHTRVVDSQLQRIRANAAAARGDGAAAAEAFGLSLAAARNLGSPYYLAPVLHDYGRWLVEDGRPDDAAPLLAEARGLFEKMGATVWLERLDELAPTATLA